MSEPLHHQTLERVAEILDDYGRQFRDKGISRLPTFLEDLASRFRELGRTQKESVIPPLGIAEMALANRSHGRDLGYLEGLQKAWDITEEFRKKSLRDGEKCITPMGQLECGCRQLTSERIGNRILALAQEQK